MNKTIKTIATSYTAVVFLVIAISGLMLYFKIFDDAVGKLHEDIGLVFATVALLHVVGNWNAMKNYFDKKIFLSAVAIITLISGVYIYQELSGEKKEHPGKAVTGKVLNASLEDISVPVFQIEYEKAIISLEKKGIKVEDEITIKEIANSNDTSAFRVLGILNNSNK